MKHPALVRALICLGIVGALEFAKAETTWHKDTPGNRISSKQAMKADEVYKCRLYELRDDRTRPSVVKGTKDTFHSQVGEGLETGAEGLADGKLVKCTSVQFNRSSGGFSKVD
jgi:hypothetical protein